MCLSYLLYVLYQFSRLCSMNYLFKGIAKLSIKQLLLYIAWEFLAKQV